MSTAAQPIFDPDAFMATRGQKQFDPDEFMASRQPRTGPLTQAEVDAKVPKTQFEKERTEGERGVGAAIKRSLPGLFKGKDEPIVADPFTKPAPAATQWSLRERLGRGWNAGGTDVRGKLGTAVAYGLGPFVGMDPQAAEEKAARADTGGLQGQTGVAMGLAASPMAGELAGKVLPSTIAKTLRTPEGGLRPGVKALLHPTSLPEYLVDKLAPERPTPPTFPGATPFEGMTSTAKPIGNAELPPIGSYDEPKIAAPPEPQAPRSRLDVPVPQGQVVRLPAPREGLRARPLTPESVPGSDLLNIARQGDPRGGPELTRRGRQVLYVPEEYPGPRLGGDKPAQGLRPSAIRESSASQAARATPDPPPGIAGVLKETGFQYMGRSGMGVTELKQPGTNISVSVLDKDLNPAAIRAKIAAKLNQFGNKAAD